MSLINDMLDNLEKRKTQTHQGTVKVEPRKRVEPPLALHKAPNKVVKPATPSRFMMFLSSHTNAIIILMSSVIVLAFIATYLSTHPRLFSQSMSTQKSTTVVNQQELQDKYYQAVSDANEGRIDLAITKLKQILAVDPNYVPAKKLYDSLTYKNGATTTS